ncbi:MAG: hypothetical protein KKE86_08990, partial [Planctomycetes bacterium]|nr:hypothetical protein [Planctomycetota bacterium]
MIWLLGGYMWLFIHRPFEVWPWLGGLHVERMYMIATILYWGIAVDKQWIRNRLNLAFACFWLAMLAAWIASLWYLPYVNIVNKMLAYEDSYGSAYEGLFAL